MIKILRIPSEKWRKNPDGFTYYHFEKSDGLVKIDYYDLEEFQNKIYVDSLDELGVYEN